MLSILIFFIELFQNKIFIAVFIANIITQVSKTIFLVIKEKEFSFNLLLRRGDMPSAHSSAVSSITTSIYLTQGMTTLTVASVVFSLIVIRDLMDVNLGIPTKKQIFNFRTYIHKPSEIFIGVLIGIIVPVLIFGLF